MVTSAGQLALFALGLLLAVCQALENSTSALSANPPMAAAVVSYFNDCPDSHSQFCFHGTCRFLVQEDKPACVCHSGYVGARCEHADLLAVVAASQKKQAITALVVVSVVALAGLIITCVLIHCCQVRKHCEWCRALICRHEKPSALLKGRTACCHSETGKGLHQGGALTFGRHYWMEKTTTFSTSGQKFLEDGQEEGEKEDDICLPSQV
ncbi:protransforming growth factor alpha isoform X1 [Molossus molossus]|uniref:protransforming growth factor alpha isoform X1 n=1 Tax=Molossus molossus TaxID=27622 RepID=UPI001746C18D|nr:protransforming growth factor alpha isoform X1 [Molossus molossus]